MRALVTGASGFIGSALIAELNTLGFDVSALMRRSSSDANLQGLKYRRVDGDLTDRASLEAAVRDVDYVFHLAGVITASSAEQFHAHNAGGTRALAEAVAKVRPGLSRFVYVSSLAAGGPSATRTPRSEREPDAPVSEYGRSKLEGERALLSFKHVFPVSIIRPPIVYGPRDRGLLFPIQVVARNWMVYPRGRGEDRQKYYSTVFVSDLCRGIIQSALAPVERVPSGEIFYLSDDEASTMERMLSVIADKLERKPWRVPVPHFAVKAVGRGIVLAGKVVRRELPVTQDKLNEILPDYWVCSNLKAREMLGFTPETDLERGMSQAIDWYRRNQWI